MKRFLICLAAAGAAPALAEQPVSELETLVPGEAGTVVLAYDVTAAGRAANCSVERSSGFARLDAASCEMMLRYARLDGAAGSARASRTIRWVPAKAVKPEPAPAPRRRSLMAAGSAADWASLNPGWGSQD